MLIWSNNTTDVLIIDENDNTQSENSVFVDPIDNKRALNANNSHDFNTSTSLYEPTGVGYFITSNGGVSWSGDTDGPKGINRLGDPATAIGKDGNLYLSYLGRSNSLHVAKSTDGGSTWSVTNLSDQLDIFADKPHLWIDNSEYSNYKNNLYLGWQNGSGLYFSRSTDEGDNWDNPIILANSVAQGINIGTNRQGVIYTTWTLYNNGRDLDETGISFTKSTDGGKSFHTPKKIQDIQGINSESYFAFRQASFPVLDVDRSGGAYNGNIYIVWCNRGDPANDNDTDDTDIYLIKSNDGGSNWSNPIQVNQDNTTAKQLYPWISVDPETGAIAVVYYDRRNLTSTTSKLDVYVSISFDGGNSWQDYKINDSSFNPSRVTNTYFTDYIGIDNRGQRLYPIWTGGRNNRALSYVNPFITIPPSLSFQNQNWNFTRSYKSQNSISISKNVDIQNNGNITLNAGNSVEIAKDFVAVKGSSFKVNIDNSLQSSSSINKGSDELMIERNSNIDNRVPNKFRLKNNYPNPFNPSTQISYEIPTRSPVKISVYSSNGKLIRTLVNTNKEPGSYSVTFRSNGLGSGVYLYRIKTNSFTKTRKMTLIK